MERTAESASSSLQALREAPRRPVKMSELLIRLSSGIEL
jgi:hypothetical protein